MTYNELQKAIRLNRLFDDSGFTIDRSRDGSIALSADAEHEKQKAFRFCADNTLRVFETIEEAASFVRGWNECKSMMQLSGQTKGAK